MFSPELREGVAAGDITVSIRLWTRPRVRAVGRYASHEFVIEIDSVEVLPFSAITDDDIVRSAEGPGRALPASARRRVAPTRGQLLVTSVWKSAEDTWWWPSN